MGFLARAVRSYPLVAATIVVAALGCVLALSPARASVPWLVGAYALLIASWEAVGMVRELVRGHAGLDILAIVAIVSTVVVGEHWAALVVVLMLTGGEALEDYAHRRSARELTALLSRAPMTAGIVRGEEIEEHPVSEVVVGDEILVRPGELVPVDGVLLDDASGLDESSLTGESLPIDRAKGERVLSGVVNGAAALRIRAVATAAQSQYQGIIRLVEEAASSKARVVRLADRYAVPFTAVSLAIAAVAWIVSGDAVRFAEVLVVATPCPLLIAAPVAFLGGMSRAAREGIIVKGGGVLERLANVRTVAFDKTGTITAGQPSLDRVVAVGARDDEVLALAASAEVYSSHVLAASVIAAAKRRGLVLLEAGEARESATNGVEAVIGGAVVRVGKPAWIAQYAADVVRPELAAGELAIYVARDGDYLGAIVMRDAAREDAARAIEELRTLGVERTLIVTGDVGSTARAIAEPLGVEEVHAECLPQDKVRIIADTRPRPLLMVGDGLNDAPVLAAADVGLAMGARGATAASESADVVNRFERLGAVPDAIRIGRDTVRIALQSIWLGIAVSVVLMVIAAGGYLPAIAGAWLQEGVDLIAILGALRALAPRPSSRG